MKAFISHSSKDKKIVLEIATQLKKEKVWVDVWDMDAGDVLADKIEKGIDVAKNFLVILSQNSINSSWVKYELNMAIYKFLENQDYRLIIVCIDDVKVPLKLQPFVRLDLKDSPNSIDKIIEIVKNTDASPKSIKRPFVNRNDELSVLEGMFYDKETKFINVTGLYGIGKTALVREALRRTYSNPSIQEISLSKAHIGSRLTLELCSLASLDIPKDGASKEELYELNLLALETLLNRNNFILFDNVESQLDEDGEFSEDIKHIVQYFSDKEIISELPIIFLSTRWTSFKFIDRKLVDFYKVQGLSDKHLSYILQSEIERIIPTRKIDSQKLLKIAERLHGYPLAARLIAPQFMKFDAEFLLENLSFITQLKIDIAEDIISNVKLGEPEVQLMEVLAIFEHPLSPNLLNQVLNLEEEEFTKCIDNLANFNLVESNGDALLLHPLVNDFYMKAVRTTSSFVNFAERLAKIANSFLQETNPTDEKYVYWLTSTCRMLFYCGQISQARQLRHDLIGELKNAAIRLYERREYEKSLAYCNEYLATNDTDKDILYYKARCLSRVSQLGESVKLLKLLVDLETRPKQLSKYNFAIGRAYVENSPKSEDAHLEEAQKYFLESIRLQEYGPALQSMAELLYRLGNYPEAASFIERKLQNAPSDPFALSIYSDILWTMDRKGEAIQKIIDALKFQPKNPNFNFRAGRFLQDSGNLPGAYKFYKTALAADETYFDARLSLCDVCLDIGEVEEAMEHIEYLKPALKGNHQKNNVLDSILANYYLKKDNIEEAEKISKRLLQAHRSVANLGLQAKVILYKYRKEQKAGLQLLADSDKTKALDLINEGLTVEPGNVQLKRMLEALQ